MTDFLATLRTGDHSLFHKINVVWANPLLDAMMPFITDLNKSPTLWLTLTIAIATLLHFRKKRAFEIACVLALTLGVTDKLCTRVFKPLFHRLRPEFSEVAIVLRAGHHSRYGFPSNHAANAFAAATFLSSLYPVTAAPAFSAAALIAYSRVYVGAHYPLDVAAGSAMGALGGWLAARTFLRFR